MLEKLLIKIIKSVIDLYETIFTPNYFYYIKTFKVPNFLC